MQEMSSEFDRAILPLAPTVSELTKVDCAVKVLKKLQEDEPKTLGVAVKQRQ